MASRPLNLPHPRHPSAQKNKPPSARTEMASAMKRAGVAAANPGTMISKTTNAMGAMAKKTIKVKKAY